MSLVSLPPPPYLVPVLSPSGILTDAWSKWFQQLYLRVGGISALSNLEVSSEFPTITLIGRFCPAVNTTMYTSPVGQNTIVDSFTVTNNDSFARAISINLVPYGAAADSTNLVVDSFSIPAKSTATVSALVGSVVGSQGFISCSANVAGVLVISSSGRLLS